MSRRMREGFGDHGLTSDGLWDKARGCDRDCGGDLRPRVRAPDCRRAPGRRDAGVARVHFLSQNRPGRRMGRAGQAVDAAARKVITDAGYGPDYKYFTHRVGHGIGMDGHEWPYLVRGNATSMVANMTFSDEPGIYIRGEFGIRIEDDMHITENGAELFTPQSPSLENPFGTA